MTGSSSGTGADLGQTASHRDSMLWWEQQLAWVQYQLIIGSCMDNTDVWGPINCYEDFVFVLGAMLCWHFCM